MAGRLDAKQIALDFVNACIKRGIPIKAAILFGSYAKGSATSYSDIDLALISDSFGKNIIVNSRQTALLNYQFPDIEVHHLSPEEFQEDIPIINEIKKTGIKIWG